ncbi:MAG: hypothetical protein NTX15_03830 [Candidatus Kapabacteria bacterium]|nr:hypothetical protein [Candidatus Kapabacteria bacterium]
MSVNTLGERRLKAIRSAQTSSAWIDRKGWSWIEMSGADRIDLLHRLTTNDLSRLSPGKGIQTVLLTDKARIIDVLTVMQGTESAHLLGSPGMTDQTIRWLRKYVIMDDVRLQDRSSEVSMVEICGPRSADVVAELLGLDVSSAAIGQWTSCTYGSGEIIVVRLPSIAEVSYWLIGPQHCVDLLREDLSANQETIPHLSEEEVEYLRVCAGMGAIGHEWSEAYNPLEAGLLHLTSFTKGCYIGQEVVARLDSYNKVKQRIMGVVSSAPLEQGNLVVDNDVTIGVVTSSVRSLDGSLTLALAYVRGEHAHPHTPIAIVTPQGTVVAEQMLAPLKDATCQ